MKNNKETISKNIIPALLIIGGIILGINHFEGWGWLIFIGIIW